MNPLRTSMLVGAVVAGATCWACSDGTVGIGEDNPQAAKTGLAAYAGSWDGYVEAYTFESGTSGRVRLVMDEQGKGEIRFGERELIAKPTDPDVMYYPPQVEELQQQFPQVTPSIGLPGPFEGFNYPLQNSTVETARVRTQASTMSIYRDYCAIQLAIFPYRVLGSAPGNASTPQQWSLGYSKTPVTLAGYASTSATVGTILVFDQAPTTVEALTTNPTHVFPSDDLTTLEEFNLKHPDYPLLLEKLVSGVCARNSDGSHELRVAEQEYLDITLDGVLGDQGNSIVGSLNLDGSTTVRTVRLTRVK